MEYICDNCDKPFNAPPCKKRKFCSRSCHMQNRGREESPCPPKEELNNLYWGKALSPSDIGGRFGVQSQTVRRWLRGYDIPVRQQQYYQTGHEPHNKLPVPPKSELDHLYNVKMFSKQQIGERYDASAGAVLGWLEYHGIERRRLRNRAGWQPDGDTLHRLYWDEWMTYEQIGKRLGVDFTAVPYWLEKFNIPKRTVWETRRGRDWEAPDPAVICHLYEGENMGMDSIGKIFDVGRTYIQNILEENGASFRRSGYPNVSHYTAKDGHKVKSGLELQVDDWLYKHGVEHIYEPPIGDTNYRADFFANGRYIEVWGIMGNERYERKRRKKLTAYERLGLPLLSVYPKDFPHLGVLSILVPK